MYQLIPVGVDVMVDRIRKATLTYRFLAVLTPAGHVARYPYHSRNVPQLHARSLRERFRTARKTYNVFPSLLNYQYQPVCNALQTMRDGSPSVSRYQITPWARITTGTST